MVQDDLGHHVSSNDRVGQDAAKLLGDGHWVHYNALHVLSD